MSTPQFSLSLVCLVFLLLPLIAYQPHFRDYLILIYLSELLSEICLRCKITFNVMAMMVARNSQLITSSATFSWSKNWVLKHFHSFKCLIINNFFCALSLIHSSFEGEREREWSYHGYMEHDKWLFYVENNGFA